MPTETRSYHSQAYSSLSFIGQVMLLVEYAKYGNLRDYLRRKRPPGHVLSGSFERDDDEQNSYKQDDNDELIRSLSTIDLIVFCLQTASGMEYLHSKKVIDDSSISFSLSLRKHCQSNGILSSVSIGIWQHVMFY
jgi:serine/threonine protein kinase